MGTPAASPERALWCAAVDQAVADALYRPSKRTMFKASENPAALYSSARRIALERTPIGGKDPLGLNAKAKEILASEPTTVARRARRITYNSLTKQRVEAREWLLGNSKDFQLVCSLAGMDPDSVLDRMQRMARNHWIVDELTRKRIAQYRDGEV